MMAYNPLHRQHVGSRPVSRKLLKSLDPRCVDVRSRGVSQVIEKIEFLFPAGCPPIPPCTSRPLYEQGASALSSEGVAPRYIQKGITKCTNSGLSCTEIARIVEALVAGWADADWWAP